MIPSQPRDEFGLNAGRSLNKRCCIGQPNYSPKVFIKEAQLNRSQCAFICDFSKKQHSIGIPVSAAVCGHDPVKVFGELTAIVGEGFFDPHAEYVLPGGKQPGGTGRSGQTRSQSASCFCLPAAESLLPSLLLFHADRKTVQNGILVCIAEIPDA